MQYIPRLLCYSCERCGIQFEISCFWCNIKCGEVFQECKTFHGAFHMTEEETEKRGEGESRGRVCEAAQPNLPKQLWPFSLHHCVCRQRCYPAKYQNLWIIGLNLEAVSHTHILAQHDSNMWSGRNPFDGSAESQDAQGHLEDIKLKVCRENPDVMQQACFRGFSIEAPKRIYTDVWR